MKHHKYKNSWYSVKSTLQVIPPLRSMMRPQQKKSLIYGAFQWCAQYPLHKYNLQVLHQLYQTCIYTSIRHHPCNTRRQLVHERHPISNTSISIGLPVTNTPAMIACFYIYFIYLHSMPYAGFCLQQLNRSRMYCITIFSVVKTHIV